MTMDKSTLLRYQGYNKTFALFENEALPQIKQIELSNTPDILPEKINFGNQRLGKLVEAFLFHQLKKQAAVQWIVENLQIQKDRQTIGELDALYYLNDTPIHLEVVYKFYLYDTLETYDEPLSYWIGPNRKDRLCYKLNKLETKQFPLLYKEETRSQLQQFNIDIAEVRQQLCFKAQLFLPYNSSKINISPLNENCITGFFISFKDISIFEDLEFYMPEKLDWLILPHNDVSWSTYESAIIGIENYISAKRSPLVWLKYNDTKFEKCFITFW